MNFPPRIVLSFDVEEFDLPLEYGQQISETEQLSVGKTGLDVITEIIITHGVTTTLFTTANFATHFPVEIKRLATTNEIASHAFYHASYKEEDLLQSRLSLEAISLTKVNGFRMPRMRQVETEALQAAGYLYDSSINPTWIPGRYNNFNLSRTIYRQNGLIRVPVSVSPLIRFPLFWLSFKNIPYRLFKSMALKTLRKDGYLSLYFHPWEFTDISSYRIPTYTKTKSGAKLSDQLHKLISDLKSEGEFCTMQQLIAD